MWYALSVRWLTWKLTRPVLVDLNGLSLMNRSMLWWNGCSNALFILATMRGGGPKLLAAAVCALSLRSLGWCIWLRSKVRRALVLKGRKRRVGGGGNH